MEKKLYSPLNLPKPLIEELKIWRVAFTAAYGKNVSYEQMMRSFLDSIEDTEPAVYAEFVKMLKAHPELMEKVGNVTR